MDSPGSTPIDLFATPSGSNGSRAGKQPLQPQVKPSSPIKTRMNWNHNLTMHFLDVVATEIEQFGRGPAGLDAKAWLRVQQEMFRRCNILIDKSQLATRYRALKKDWQCWLMLTEDRSVTGLGRDPLTNAISAPAHWWATMILKNKDAGKFMYKPLEHEQLMGRVFRDVRHHGGHSWVPGQEDQCPPIIVEGTGDSDSSQHLGDSATPPDIAFVSEFPTPAQKKRVIEPLMEDRSMPKNSKHRSTPTGSGKLSGSMETIMKSLSQPEVVQLRRGENTIKEAHQKLKKLPIFVDDKNLELRMWALDLLKSSYKNVEIFCDLESDREMMAWLRRQHMLEVLNAKKERSLPPVMPDEDDE